MKSIVYFDPALRSPAALLLQGFVYRGTFHGTRIGVAEARPQAAIMPLGDYCSLLHTYAEGSPR